MFSRGFVRGLALGVALLTAAPAGAEWRRLDSPNFVVVGDVGERTLKDIAVRFEAFRETLSRVFTSRVTSTAVPTVIVVFPSSRAFTPVKPLFNGKPVELSGYFHGGADVNLIAVVADGNPEGLRVIFHEYAHLVVSNVVHQIPVWLNEGLAEYYSTFDLAPSRESAVIGRIVQSHIADLTDQSLLPLSTLLATTHDSPLYNEGSRRSMFYAESWALTHLLIAGEPDRSKAFGDYLTLTSRGMSATDAWTKAFGDDPIERALREYVHQRAFHAVQYQFSEKIAAFDAKPATIPAGDAEGYLAMFLVLQRRFDEAAAHLAKGAGGAAPSPWLSAVGASVAAARQDGDAVRQALPSPEPAADWLTAYVAGMALVDVAQRDRTLPPDVADAARRQLDAARRNGGDYPNAAIQRVLLDLDGGAAPSAENVEAVVRARTLAPGRYDYAFTHGRVLARRGQFAEARNAVSPLMSAAYPEATRNDARRLMTYIVEMEQYAQRQTQGSVVVQVTDTPATSAPASSSGTAPGDAANASTDVAPIGARPEPKARPYLREVGAGEQRVEGTLTQIECPKGSAAILHLKLASGELQIKTPDMGGIDFITYRDDLRGSVGCGVLKAPLHVLVTTGPAPQVVVAVEFLPD